GYTGLTTAQPIPDGGTLTVPLTVYDSLQVNDLSVGVNLTHAQVSDLTVTLIAPDNTQIPLVLSGLAGTAGLVNTVFDDYAPTATGATISLTYQTLSALNGKNYLGTWKLQIKDNSVNTKTGSLLGWSLNPVTVSPYQIGVTGAAIVSGGKGYTAGDLLTVLGG